MANKKFVGIVGAAAVSAAISYAVGNFAFHQVIDREAEFFRKVADKVNNDPSKPPKEFASAAAESEAWFEKQEVEEVTMTNDRGQLLKGYYFPAEKKSDVFVFCSHGYRSSGKGEYGKFTKFYHELGVNIFLVDHQSAGESEGDYIGFAYYEYQDGLKWLNYLTDRFGDDIQIFLHGISMGSATVMMMTGDIRLPQNVKFTIADCGFTTAWDEFAYNLDGLHVPRQPLLGITNFISRRKAGYDFKEADALSRVKHARVPMLFIHGECDTLVPTRMGYELYDACNAPYKDLVIVDGAEHAESYRVNPEIYEEKVCEFIDNFVKLPQKSRKKS